jgi:hypothetical protein
MRASASAASRLPLLSCSILHYPFSISPHPFTPSAFRPQIYADYADLKQTARQRVRFLLPTTDYRLPLFPFLFFFLPLYRNVTFPNAKTPAKPHFPPRIKVLRLEKRPLKTPTFPRAQQLPLPPDEVSCRGALARGDPLAIRGGRPEENPRASAPASYRQPTTARFPLSIIHFPLRPTLSPLRLFPLRAIIVFFAVCIETLHS